LDRWWLIGCMLLAVVFLLARAFYDADAGRHRQREQEIQHQAVAVLAESVHGVLAGQNALVRVIEADGLPARSHWPALADVVTNQPAATSAGFIVPVRAGDRTAFERRTGLRLLESPEPGVVRPDPIRALYLAVVDSWSKASGKPMLGLDVASNSLRRELMLRAGAEHRQLATPPVRFLGRSTARSGVIVYDPVYSGRQVEGWVTVSYTAAQLAAAIRTAMPGVRVTIHDGAATVLSGHGRVDGAPTIVGVAGRRWLVWASIGGSGISAVPWLVLAFGAVITAAISLLLRQALVRERASEQARAEQESEERALGRIASLVAQGAAPDAVFGAVAKEIGGLLGTRTAAVSRFDAYGNRGIIVGGWSSSDVDLMAVGYALDGVTASAKVFRTGKPARVETGYQSPTDPIAPLMSRLDGTGGIAAPIIVDGQLWGAVGAAYSGQAVPVGDEDRLNRFGRYVGIAISHADTREKLDRLASTDPLTGIANRRVFEERLRSELERARRHGRELSVALLDIDHFKQINDRYGHQVGDGALVGFAAVLARHARQSDLIGRVGGEEFAWLMPETNARGAYDAAERVRLAIANHRFGKAGWITASVGVAQASRQTTAKTLLRDADHALYEAKRAGRNRTGRQPDQRPAEHLDEGGTWAV
jgi:diguanylate cyclase (GGDEF)-like protein